MSNQHSVTKRHRRPKSGKRTDYTARTMAAVKQLSRAANVRESQSPLPKSGGFEAQGFSSARRERSLSPGNPV
jgi:hypothetical protein